MEYWNNAYFQQVNGYMQMLHDRISTLEKSLLDLQKELADHKQNQQPTSIEYKFDQLKVETLEGTLNIGLSPQSANEAIDDFQVQNHQLNVPRSKEYPTAFENIRTEIYHYLDHECVPVIEELEHRYQFPLQPEYRHFIINDVKNQMDQRICHYLNQMNIEQLTKEQIEELEYQTKSKVKDDINKTFELFIQNLPKETGGANQ
ncbi:spore germination protein GerPC [Alkalihalobacillus sp. MEB130]|uniref:spore germination protein GerPC n=1 Tax=Alkalihalobacillus sp. MEB130 TaxID=2976704 RepID=UPI0028DEF1CC|nr:spore germination protein GerPC [Alkalihalobacillus sp. MEB130]MDT8860287.1 spore germination protein GerPC [Alkalihalobacillus sp. MEB130]